MEKDYIKQLIRESATKVCQTLNALQTIERQFDDELVDENGKKYSAKTGRYRGRPALTAPKNWNEVYAAWKAGEITAKEAMEKTETKRTSFYKLVKLTEEEQNKN